MPRRIGAPEPKSYLRSLQPFLGFRNYVESSRRETKATRTPIDRTNKEASKKESGEEADKDIQYFLNEEIVSESGRSGDIVDQTTENEEPQVIADENLGVCLENRNQERCQEKTILGKGKGKKKKADEETRKGDYYRSP